MQMSSEEELTEVASYRNFRMTDPSNYSTRFVCSANYVIILTYIGKDREELRKGFDHY